MVNKYEMKLYHAGTTKEYKCDDDVYTDVLIKKYYKKIGLGPNIEVLGEGEEGMVVKTPTDGMVLKIIDLKGDKSGFNQEVKVLKYLNCKRTNVPLVPRFYGSTIINNKLGVIAMQDVAHVFPNAENVYEFANMNNKYKAIGPIRNAMKRLHKLGIGHGDMHNRNIYIVKLKNGKYRAFFIDFGLGYKLKNGKKTNNKMKFMGKYVNAIRHPVFDVDIVPDVNMLKEYDLAFRRPT